MRPRPGFGMELHRARPFAGQRKALDGPVVERDVRDLRPVASHREAVVLARDQHAVRAQVEHRVVRAAVPEGKLERLEARRQREQLVAEADPEQGDAADVTESEAAA